MNIRQRLVGITSCCLALSVLAGTEQPIDTNPFAGLAPKNNFLDASFPTLPTDLLPPGARALGLGGAFSAVADDATAAEANPAGLTILRRSEFSVHLRNSDVDARFVDLEALDSGVFNNVPGQLIKSYEDESTDVSFASFVKPFDRWVFSAFYGNQLNVSAATPVEEITDSGFLDLFTNNNALDAEVEGYGISGAFKLNRRVSLGLTVKRVELDLRAAESMVIEDFNDFEFVFGDDQFNLGTPADFASVINDRIIGATALDDSDAETVFNLGVLLNPNGKWSMSAVYRKGATFNLDGNTLQQSVMECVGDNEFASICNQVFDLLDADDPAFLQQFNTSISTSRSAEVAIPDRLTLGFAMRPSDTWLLALDLNFIDYASLPKPRQQSLVVGTSSPTQRLEDEITVHLGVEKVFPIDGGWLDLLTVRAGIFEEKDHDGFRALDSDDTHYTFGVGAVFKRLQVDFAYESSDAVDNFVVSGILRF